MDPQNFESHPLYAAYLDVVRTPSLSHRFFLSAVLHLPTENYKLFSVLKMDRVCDYESSMMDDFRVTVKIPAGDYHTKIYPSREILELTIEKRRIGPTGSGDDGEQPISFVRYRAFLENDAPNETGTPALQYSTEDMNLSDMVFISFRLVEREAEFLRIKQVQGIARGARVEDLLRTWMVRESQNVRIDGVNPEIQFDIYPADQKAVISEAVIPSGTYLCELPTFFQQRVSGVYQHGIGTYFQRYRDTMTWFVYPLFRYQRFDDARPVARALIYGISPQRALGIENTFSIEGQDLRILSTTDKKVSNVSTALQTNAGVGFRWADPEAFFKKPVEIDEKGRALANRARLNREVILALRQDGLQYAPVINDPTTNPYAEYSKIAQRLSAILTLGWDNSDASLLYPGMPVRYCYAQANECRSLDGQLLGVHTASQNKPFKETTMLHIAVYQQPFGGS